MERISETRNQRREMQKRQALKLYTTGRDGGDIASAAWRKHVEKVRAQNNPESACAQPLSTEAGGQGKGQKDRRSSECWNP
jgi:hypothetical protein